MSIEREIDNYVDSVADIAEQIEAIEGFEFSLYEDLPNELSDLIMTKLSEDSDYLELIERLFIQDCKESNLP